MGTLPALRAARLGQNAALAGLRGIVGGASGRRLGIFVTAEIAAAVMLVISAVLLARSLAVQVGVDIGFSGDRLVAAEVAPSPVRHPNDAVRLDFYADLEQRLRTQPFVGGVGLSTAFRPFGAVGGGSVFRIEGRPNPATEGGEWPWADLRTAVNADFLRTLDVSIIAGRPFTESDVSGTQRVVLISQRLAETWWPDETAALMSSLSSQLFGVGPWDPFTYTAVPVLFVTLAVAAAWLPARRATKLYPVAVLRAE